MRINEPYISNMLERRRNNRVLFNFNKDVGDWILNILVLHLFDHTDQKYPPFYLEIINQK